MFNKILSTIYLATLTFLNFGFIYSAQDLSLKFTIWKESSVSIVSNQIGTFEDGDFVSIIHNNNYDFNNDIFSLEIVINNKKYVNSFKINSLNDKTIWICVDPTLIENNPTFSEEFLKVLSSLPKGRHLVLINFKVNDVIVRRGSLYYISDGVNKKYKKIIKTINSPEFLKHNAESELKKESDKIKEEDSNLKDTFKINFKNDNKKKTYYIVLINKTKNKELIYEIKPQMNLCIELESDNIYEAKYFCCDRTKNKSKYLNKIDYKWNNKIIVLK